MGEMSLLMMLHTMVIYLEPCMIIRTIIMVVMVRETTLPRLRKVPRKYLG